MKKKGFFGILTALALALVLMLGMSVTVYGQSQYIQGRSWRIGDQINLGNTQNIYIDDRNDHQVSSGAQYTTVPKPEYNSSMCRWEFKGIFPAYGGQRLDLCLGTGTTTGNETVTGFKWKSGTGGTSQDPFRFELMFAPSSVTLNEDSIALTEGETKTLTAAISPENATDRKVKWSVIGDDTNAVGLYENDCITPVGTDGTETITVCVKGLAAGSAAIKVESNENETLFDTCPVTVSADSPVSGPVPYMDWDGTRLVMKDGDEACTDYTVVDESTTAFEDGKWYVVSSNVTISSRITVSGTAHLILCNEKILNANAGITVEGNNNLTIYAQSTNINTMGVLNAISLANESVDPKIYPAGIGSYTNHAGTVIINGGNITAKGNRNGSGSDAGAAGIGGGYTYSSPSMYVHNYVGFRGADVTINGGKVTAYGGNCSPGIGNGFEAGIVENPPMITINGGTVIATGGYRGAGIGGASYSSSANVTINGGDVTATSFAVGSGIGDGNNPSNYTPTITINGGNVTASGGNNKDSYKKGAGIGSAGSTSSANANRGTIVLGDNVTVYAGSQPNPTQVVTDTFPTTHTQQYVKTISITNVTSVTLEPNSEQSITVSDKVFFTAEVSPENATDKTVKWSVGGTNDSAVKLYTDESCTTEVGSDATERLTVYARGENIGTAIVTVTSNADSTKYAACTVTVNKNPQTITADDVDAAYGDTDKSVSAIVTEPASGGGEISFTVKDGSGDYIEVDDEGKLTIKAVPADGKAWVIVTAAETSTGGTGGIGYAAATKEVTVNISKAELTVRAVDQNVMIGETVPDLSTPVLATHYSVDGLVGTDTLTTAPTLKYQKNNSEVTPDNTQAGTYDIVPSGADAGGNYNIVSYVKGILTITAKDPQIITAEDVNAVYGDTDKQVSAETSGNGEISFAVKDGSGDYIEVGDEGKLTIKAVPADGKAYVIVSASETSTGGTNNKGYAAAAKEVTVNIKKAELTITATNQNIMVGEPVPDLSMPVLVTHYSVDGLVGTDTLTTAPTLKYQKNDSEATPDNTKAGTYDIVPSGADAGGNYNIVSYENGLLTINKAAQTITAEDVYAAYGDTDKKVAAAADGGGKISYAVKPGSEAFISVDKYTGELTIKAVPADGKAYVTVTAAETDAYLPAVKDVTVNISRGEPKYTAPAPKTLEETGSPQELVEPGSTEDGIMYYAVTTGETEPADDSLYSQSVPMAAESGTYYVWYKVAGDENHSDTEPKFVKVVIRSKISAVVTFRVINGSWNDGTDADKTVTLNGYEGDTLKLTADQIPAAGDKPNDGYKAGSWDVTPDTDSAVAADTIYTYTYVQKESISLTVTFRVINGSWNDGTAADKTVTLNGYEGDTLKLTADQIPVAGDKPNDGYKAGTWDVTPDTNTAITEDTTYVYIYIPQSEPSDYYSLEVMITGNGDVELSDYADKGVNAAKIKKYTVQAGKPVLLEVIPDAGYKLERLIYTAGGRSQDITNTRSFTMPAADVKAAAVFVKAGGEPGPDHPVFFFPDDGLVLPRTGFSAAGPQRLPEKPLELKYQPVKQRIEIPSASVAAEIVLVPFADGEYPVTWLGDKAGLLEGSALPGEGQSVLTGHNHLDTKAAGPFAGLSRLKEGDRIFVSGERGEIQTFVVYANAKIAETGISAVNQLIAGDPLSLTLITCEDERPEGGYANRRVIAARPL